MALELSSLTRIFTENRPIKQLHEYSIRHNPDMVKAREALGAFAAQYFEFSGHRDDFTLIKKFTMPGTGVDVLADQSLLGKIIVEKIHPKRESPRSYLHFISTRRKGRYGEPIIYKLNTTKLINSTNYKIRVHSDTPQNTIWKQILEQALRDPNLVTHQLIEMNKEARDNIGFFDSLFHVQSHPAFDQSVEIWQKGNVEKLRHASRTPRKILEAISPRI